MSVLIKGMHMPENCIECMSSGLITAIKCTEWTKISAGRRENERAWSCPLVDLGKHGDLIDRQKLIEDNKHLEYPTDGKYRRDRAWAVGFNAGARHCNEHAVYAKAVIEAEGG